MDEHGRATERGSAAVELVFLTVVFLVPLFYLEMTVSRVQAGSYAASTAAREAGRAYVTARDQASAEERAGAAARVAFEDQGFGVGDGRLTIACDGSPCLRPEGRVEMTTRVVVRVRAPLPVLGPFGPGSGLDLVGRAFLEQQ
jgi:hypothetical protein